jgi:hypothetical protein
LAYFAAKILVFNTTIFRGDYPKGRDYASERIFRFDKIKSVEIVDSAFGEKSQSIKAEGWDGCIGKNCFIKQNVCE